SVSAAGLSGFLLLTIAGGIVCGAAVGGLALLIAGRTDDHLVEITLTTLAAYSSFLLAEHFHMSGVLATLTAGLVVGEVGWRGAIDEASSSHFIAFWEYAALLSTSYAIIRTSRSIRI